jgi:FkbM family methyltransferase
MLCEFRPAAAPLTFMCSRCGQVIQVRSPRAAGRIRAECQVVDLRQPARRRPCVFLGPQLGEQPCETCRGHVALKVFRCLHERHDRTTLPACGTCPDYTPAQPLPSDERRMLLRFPHGFGDAVQLTTVLLHLRELYPQWAIDVAAKRGAHTLLEGLCRRAFTLEEEPLGEPYDIRRTLWWHEPDACYADSPATKAEKSLRETFLIEPREALCRYAINPGAEARRKAHEYAEELAAAAGLIAASGDASHNAATAAGRFVLLHYQGNSARANKNLDERMVKSLCDEIVRLGYIPVVLDWDERSGLVDQRRVFCPGVRHSLWGGTGTGDGATIAALAELAAWCVGIDSGPGHVFGAIATPAVIVWTRHHPLHYYGLAEHVTHLVPYDHASLLRGDRDVGRRYFEAKYHFRVYADLERSLVRLAREFLAEGPTTPPPPAPSPLMIDGDHFVRREHHPAEMVIVRDVYLEDCYRVSELPRAPRYVVDVGAHIGTFAMRVRRRTALAKIICVEANSANMPALRANVSQFAEIVPAACTYEPGEVGLLSTIFAGTENTGGSTVAPLGSAVWQEQSALDCYRPGGTLPKITLEEIARHYELPRIDLLKLDCEGSELSILEHCDLGPLRHIVGEYHDATRFLDLIRRRFAGWNIRWLREGAIGLFWLWR